MKKLTSTRIFLVASLCSASLLCLHSTVQAQAYVNGNSVYGLQQNSTGGLFYIQPGTGQSASQGPIIQFFTSDQGNSFWNGSTNFLAGTNGQIAFSFQTRDANSNVSRILSIFQSNQVRIGNTSPQSQPDYKLAVDGKIVAKSVFVTSPGTWSDFVFEPTYKRMSLPRLENYLKINKHLPAIPSAKKVETEGYSITEMDTKLLQAVEELTLHVIELNKENVRMRQELTKLQKQYKTMHGKYAHN